MRKGAKIGLIGGVTAVMVGVAGYGIVDIYGGLTGGDSAKAAPVETGPPTAKEIRATARDFLAAWAKGDAAGAAALTDDRAAAQAALTGYRGKAHISDVTLTPGAATGAAVPFTVDATISYGGKKTPWTYKSSLTVVRGTSTGKPVVGWKPAVLHPHLKAGQSLATGKVGTPEMEVVDHNGKKLDGTQYPSLNAVLPDLRKRYADDLTGGSPGITTSIVSSDGTPGETLKKLSPGTPGKLTTTLDAGLQTVAENAVKSRKQASVAAVRASTGEILAFANNPATANNNAFNAQLAPGSTFKIITSSALLNAGVSPSSSAPCPHTVNYKQGKPFTNIETDYDPSATFAKDFEISCNTGFINMAHNLDDNSVPTAASKWYGFGQTWNVGVLAFDGKIPGGSGDEMTGEMIGQGHLQMSPLNMASVSATVDSGAFRQPRLVAANLIKGGLATASPLPAGIRSNLKSLMNLTARAGTADVAMSGVQGDMGAKTGTAEVGGQVHNNGWFTAYRGDVAAAGLVIEGDEGGPSAGPIVAQVLKSAQ